MSLVVGGIRTYKRRLTRFVLAIWNLVNSTFQNNAAQDAHGVYILNVRVLMAYIYTYGVGYGVVCSDVKAIPEPYEAEQQDCSSAFVIPICKKNCIMRFQYVA